MVARYCPKIFYVYALFRPDTGQVCYIGKGHNGRWLDQARRPGNIHLKRLIRKLGTTLISVRIRTGLTEQEAFATEIAFIKSLGRQCDGGILVNFSTGGEGGAGSIRSKKTRAKLSASKLGKKPSQEALVNMSRAQLGRIHSVESRAARSRKLKGRTFTVDWRKRLSASAKKRDRSDGYSDEHRASIAAGVAAWWKTQSAKQRSARTEAGRQASIRARRKEVTRCLSS